MLNKYVDTTDRLSEWKTNGNLTYISTGLLGKKIKGYIKKLVTSYLVERQDVTVLSAEAMCYPVQHLVTPCKGSTRAAPDTGVTPGTVSWSPPLGPHWSRRLKLGLSVNCIRTIRFGPVG